MAELNEELNEKITSSSFPEESSDGGVMPMFSWIFLWCASQLNNLALVAEAAAEYPWSLSTSASVVLVTSCFVWYCLCAQRKPPRQASQQRGSPSEEFIPATRSMRKRDIVKHFGRRVIKRVSGSRLADLRRRSMDLRFHPPPGNSEIQLHKEPPAGFLEADVDLDSQIPHDVMYLLKSVRVFGHFEKPLFMELCKHVETKFVPAGAILFRPGQVDDSIYVVQNGKLKVFLLENDGTELPLKDAGTGDSVHSLLSLLDCIIDQPSIFKAVAARAERDTYVLQIKGEAFKQFFDDNPDSLIRIIQIIMLRLQRVTFLTLNQFLGLGHELVLQRVNLQSNLNVHKFKRCPTTVTSRSTNNSSEMDSLEIPMLSATKVSMYVESEESEGGEDFGPNYATRGSSSDRNSDEQHSPDVLSSAGDDSASLFLRQAKTVAINTNNNEQFTHRLIPAQSTEFDNVINQARVDRMEFSGSLPSKANLKLKVPLRYSHFVSLDSSELLEAATKDLVSIFKLKDDTLLKGRIQLIEVHNNSILGHEGDLDSCVYFIVTGKLKVLRLSSNHEVHEDLLYVAQPSEFVGVLSALTGEPSFVSIKAASYCHLVAITKTNLYQILSEHPIAVFGIAFDLVRRLSPFVRQVDFALDWTELEAGKALYRQSDESTNAYIILNGRLRSVRKNNDGKKQLVDEYGRGEIVGVVEVMTKSTRTTTVHAIRDTELACLPVGLLNTVKIKKPQVVSRLIQLIGERIIGSYSRTTTPLIDAGSDVSNKHMTSNLSTVAVVPMTADIPISNFTHVLTAAVKSIASVKRLTSDVIKDELGLSAIDSVHEYRLSTWLSHQEDTHRIVIYQADRSLTQWTARCIRQADCILLIGIAKDYPDSNSLGVIAKEVERISFRVRKELVLLHDEGVSQPTGTVKWLNALGWVSSHFHIRCQQAIFSESLSTENEALLSLPNKHSDFSRLARRLTGTSVGLVLGGGGARGLSHCGIIKAFSEAGIPIDMIGGTSIGSLVGGLYCEDCDNEIIRKRCRKFSIKMSGYFDKVLDLTWPTTSMFTGRAFNGLIYSVFGDRQIEDLWIPYFCITTDITDSKMRVHTSGCLWRYVRASMSLSGYLPPLCDPVDGHLLLDGGYVNNLPADIMAARGAETIIAVDVESATINDWTNYGDDISGFSLLLNRLNPFSKKKRVPTLTEIQSRLAYVSCVRQSEIVKTDLSCEYIRPPVQGYATLQFGSFDEIFDIGYRHCMTVVAEWTKNKALGQLSSQEPGTRKSKSEHRHERIQSEQILSSEKKVSSIHDLAALAAEITVNRPDESSLKGGDDDIDGEDDIDNEGYWSNPEHHLSPNELASVDSSSKQLKKVVFSDSEIQ